LALQRLVFSPALRGFVFLRLVLLFLFPACVFYPARAQYQDRPAWPWVVPVRLRVRAAWFPARASVVRAQALAQEGEAQRRATLCPKSLLRRWSASDCAMTHPPTRRQAALGAPAVPTPPSATDVARAEWCRGRPAGSTQNHRAESPTRAMPVLLACAIVWTTSSYLMFLSAEIIRGRSGCLS
jgi:hypothetical protein